MTGFKHTDTFLERVKRESLAQAAVNDLVVASATLREIGPRVDTYTLARIVNALGRAGILKTGDDPTIDTFAAIGESIDRVEKLTAVIANRNQVPWSREGHSTSGLLILGASGIAHTGINPNSLAEGRADVEPRPIPKTGL